MQLNKNVPLYRGFTINFVGRCSHLKHVCFQFLPRSYEDNPEEAMKQCQILLEEPDIETAVRIGDVYGIMIEHLAREQNYSKVSN